MNVNPKVQIRLQKLTVKGRRSVVSLSFKCEGYFTVPLALIFIQAHSSPREREREREKRGKGKVTHASTQICILSYFDFISKPKESQMASRAIIQQQARGSVLFNFVFSFNVCFLCERVFIF